MGDIFGNNMPEALDTSDIDDRWEPVTDDAADAVAEHDDAAEAELDEADEAEVDGDGPALGEGVADDDTSDGEDADEADDAPAPVDIPAHLAGKTPAELARIVQDSQSQIGRQSSEVAELRRVTEEQAAQVRELLEMLQQPAAPEIDTSGLVAQAFENPRGAYGQAVQLVDNGHATPDLVEDIIEAVADMDPKLSRQMASDFTRRMVTAQLRAEFDETIKTKVEPLAKNDYVSQLNMATSSLYADPVLGEDAKAYEQEVVAMLKGKPLGADQHAIRAQLENALTVARGQDPTKSSAYKKALEAMRIDAQTELGNAPEVVEKKSEADAYREARFTRSSERDPGAALFA